MHQIHLAPLVVALFGGAVLTDTAQAQPADTLAASRASATLNRAWDAFDAGDTPAALALADSALALAEAALPAGTPDLADYYDSSGWMYRETGQFDRAVARHEQAVAAYADGADPSVRGDYENNLGLALLLRGDFARARTHYEASVAAKESLSPSHPDVAIAAAGLGVLLQQTGEWDAARQRFEQAIAVNTASHGAEALQVASDLNLLGFLLAEQGDFAEAERAYTRALAIVATTDEPFPGRTLHNLGVLHVRQGRVDAAAERLEAALAMREAALGPDHLATLQTLDALARVAEVRDRLDEARTMLLRTLEGREAVLGATHPNVASTLDALARVEIARGDTTAARRYADAALETWTEALGPDHPDVARSLLARAHRFPDAQPGLLRAAAILDAHADRVLPTLSAAEQRAMLDTDLARASSLLLDAFADDPDLPRAYAFVSRWKGLLVHGLRRQARLDALTTDATLAPAVAALNAVRADLAGLRYARMSRAALTARADSLSRRREALERELARALPDGDLDDPLRDAGTLASTLPPRSALVDLYRTGFVSASDTLAPAYLAVVTAPGHPLRAVRLGSVDDLDPVVYAWRDAAVAGRRADDEAAALAAAVWAPIAATIPDETETLWISPDALLARVAWPLLAERDASTATMRVAVADSPRELVHALAPLPASTSTQGVLAVGGVDFGEDADGWAGPWAPLDATGAEATTVAGIARDADWRVTLLSGEAATPRAVLRALPEAAVVHIATHGYFDGAAGGPAPEWSGEAPPRPGQWSRNPLIDNGLALAGANAGPDGALSAEALVGLDLNGARLVVLSACETGRGAETAGQGVLGLRAALAAAGARRLLVSLWPVPDGSTSRLMAHFYNAMLQRQSSPADALREAQAALRDDPATAAQIHWAGWVLAGDAARPVAIR